MRILVVLLLAAFVAAEQKREADPGFGLASPVYGLGFRHGLGYGYGPAIAYHPYGGRSYSNFNLHSIHKREADPGFLPSYGYGHGLALGHSFGYGYGPAVAYHPYGGTSYVQSYQHSLHKREADPGFLPSYGYGVPAYGYGSGYGLPSYGYGRRYDGHGAVYGFSTGVQHPGYGYSYQHQSGVVPPSYGHFY